MLIQLSGGPDRGHGSMGPLLDLARALRESSERPGDG